MIIDCEFEQRGRIAQLSQVGLQVPQTKGAM
jgi:hypothetical protein